jgi:hypothetical protein
MLLLLIVMEHGRGVSRLAGEGVRRVEGGEGGDRAPRRWDATVDDERERERERVILVRGCGGGQVFNDEEVRYGTLVDWIEDRLDRFRCM